jgi:hypothetical protein
MPVTRTLRVRVVDTTSGQRIVSTESVDLGAAGTVLVSDPEAVGGLVSQTVGGGGVVDQGAAGIEAWLVDTTGSSIAVSNFPATQPVSGTVGVTGSVAVTGPATDAQLRATPLPVSGTVTATGPLTDAQLRAATVPVSFAAATTLFTGRASTFRTPGRAGTAGQKIMSLHNATGSAVTVRIKKVVVDFACTVVKAITVLPPVIRLYKVTVLPTNGTALGKVKIGGTTTSSASVTILGDASADGTLSASALTATLPAGQVITQEYAPRFITAAGYEPADRIEFEVSSDIVLGALEGVVLNLDYVLATMNPATDMWIASVEWTES